MISAATKLVLVPAPRQPDRMDGVRRYRLARLPVNPVRDRGGDSFDHLKRVYD